MKTVIHSSIFLVNEKDEVLLVREGKEKVHGLWNLPGGKVEHGEEIEKAAIREAEEETGLNVRPTHLIGIYTSNNDEADYVHFVFFAKYFLGTLHLSDPKILDAQWMPLSKLQMMNEKELLNAQKIHQIYVDYKAGQLPNTNIIKQR